MVDPSAGPKWGYPPARSRIMVLLGGHMSIAGGVQEAPGRARKMNCEAFQIFSKNQRQWRSKDLTPDQLELWHASMREHGYDGQNVFIHASYLINPCTQPEKLSMHRAALADEMVRANQLGVRGVCFHPGSHLGDGPDVGMERLIETMGTTLDAVKGTALLMPEVMAGHKNHMGSILEEIGTCIEGFPKDRVAVTLDTCHLFAGGYDLVKDYDSVMAEIERLIGVDRVGAWHLNDSKFGLGAKKDRHEHIGKGEMGLEAFRHLVNDTRFTTVPASVETEEDGQPADVATLRSLRTT